MHTISWIHRGHAFPSQAKLARIVLLRAFYQSSTQASIPLSLFSHGFDCPKRAAGSFDMACARAFCLIRSRTSLHLRNSAFVFVVEGQGPGHAHVNNAFASSLQVDDTMHDREHVAAGPPHLEACRHPRSPTTKPPGQYTCRNNRYQRPQLKMCANRTRKIAGFWPRQKTLSRSLANAECRNLRVQNCGINIIGGQANG